MTDIAEPAWIIVYGGDGRPAYVVHEGGEKLLCNPHDEIQRLQAELTEWREEPFGGLVRAGVLFMSPERVEEAKAQARRAGIEAAAKVCNERMHAYRAGTPTDETIAAIEEISDLIGHIRALLEEDER